MFSEKDKKQISQHGMTPDIVEAQIKRFRNGFPFLKLYRPARLNDGIKAINEPLKEHYLKVYQEKKKTQIVKFVPASGAASRMFKHLFEFEDAFIHSGQDTSLVNQEQFRSAKEFFQHLPQFAFYNELKGILLKQGKDINQLVEEGSYDVVLKFFLTDAGMNYGELPKGLLHFHKYDNYNRTAVEEHLVEGAQYASTSDNRVVLHLTVSPEHRTAFKALLEKVASKYEKQFNLKYDFEFSEQEQHTDTIAVDMNNEPFRPEDGSLLFRPAGHGALLENLNAIDAELIFIKNIDNVVPDRLKETTILNKKIIAGVLLELQQHIFKSLELLNNEQLDQVLLEEITDFARKELFLTMPDDVLYGNREFLIEFLKMKLNRPLRICGVVRNQGEPGGGPFWAKGKDGSISLQIVESSQVDMNDEEQHAVFGSSTHFNPVDLVLGVRNYKGEKFNLSKYSDPETGFISKKSKDGRDLKALELPGLWNGAMSDWITIFVEVPGETFTPVKTINDLLRPAHQ
jgi:hypothetical protein